MTELTKKQAEILLFMKKFHKEKDYYPSLREIAANFKVNAATIRQQLMSAEKKGYIERFRMARMIKFLKPIK